MSYPLNPETIILKNEFYPNGLREIDIWNYYQKIKVSLLRETIGKNLIVFFSTDLNKTIVIRKNKQGRLIRLNFRDYNQIVSGRTLSFHNVMGKYSNYGIIDIDTENFNLAKESVEDLYFLIGKKFKLVNDIKIIFSGKNSFHLRLYFNSEYKIQYVKDEIYNFLVTNNIEKNYTISYKVLYKNIPNLDLNRNVYNAGYIALNSLSVNGLRCMEIEQKKLRYFKKEIAKITI